MDLSSDGRYLAVGGADGAVFVWDLDAQGERLCSHLLMVTTMWVWCLCRSFCARHPGAVPWRHIEDVADLWKDFNLNNDN